MSMVSGVVGGVDTHADVHVAAEVTRRPVSDGRPMAIGLGRGCTAWHKTDIEPCDCSIPVHDGTGHHRQLMRASGAFPR